MGFLKSSGILMASVALAGCASTPASDIVYYHPTASAKVEVIQTAACSKGASPIPFVETSLVVTPTFSADIEDSHTVELERLSTAFSNSKLAFEFYDDGRLKSVNAENTGRGEEVIKAAVGLVGQVLTLDSSEVKAACERLGELSEKTLTIKRIGFTNFQPISCDGTLAQLGPEDDISGCILHSTPLSASDMAILAPIFGELTLSFEVVRQTSSSSRSALAGEQQAASTTIELKAPVNARIEVGLTGAAASSSNLAATMRVPQFGNRYYLPLPAPPMFGGTNFELKLTESGVPTLISYHSTSGVADGLGSADEVLQALVDTDSEKLAELKSENDLIKEQQRNILCRATQEEC